MSPSVCRVQVEGSQWQAGVTPVTPGVCLVLAVVCMAQRHSLALRVPAATLWHVLPWVSAPQGHHLPPSCCSWGGSWGQWLASGLWAGASRALVPGVHGTACLLPPCMQKPDWALHSMAFLCETGKGGVFSFACIPLGEDRKAGSLVVFSETD